MIASRRRSVPNAGTAEGTLPPWRRPTRGGDTVVASDVYPCVTHLLLIAIGVTRMLIRSRTSFGPYNFNPTD